MFFTVLRSDDGRTYAHAEVRFYQTNAKRSVHASFCKVVWQSDCDQDIQLWYCPHVEARTDTDTGLSAPEQFALVSRLVAAHPVLADPRPWVAQLQAAGIPRCIWDGRVGLYLPPDQVLGPEYSRWMARNPGGWCVVSDTARNESDARHKLTLAFADEIKRGYSPSQTAAAFADWMARGQPVEEDRREVPARESLDVLLRPLGKAPPAEPAATSSPAPDAIAA